MASGPDGLGEASWAWHLLHQSGLVVIGDGAAKLYVLYPLIPWIGVMAAGYLLGPLMQHEPETRRRLLFRLGAVVTLAFVVLRATNFYGDPAPWTIQEGWTSAVLSFLNCEKYPPSLLFLLMTLGPAMMLLAYFEKARGAFIRWLATYGQVPFFFYVVHVYLIHALAVAAGFALTGTFARTPMIGLNLPGIYVVWLFVLVLLYPAAGSQI